PRVQAENTGRRNRPSARVPHQRPGRDACHPARWAGESPRARYREHRCWIRKCLRVRFYPLRWGLLQHAMLERGKVPADFRLAGALDLRNDTTSAARQALQHAAPIVDDETVAVGLATVRVKSRLCRGDDITEILDRPGAHQGLPVRTSRRT